MKAFKSRQARNRYFRTMVSRTDRIARKVQRIRELDQRRIAASGLEVGRSIAATFQPLPSPLRPLQAER